MVLHRYGLALTSKFFFSFLVQNHLHSVKFCVQMECGRLSGVRGYLELFGGQNRKGLLDYVGNGTLLLNQVEQLPPEAFAVVSRLASTGEYYPLGAVGEEASLRKTKCKVVFSFLLLKKK